MKKITRSILAFAALSILAVSCSNSSDPKSVVKEFFSRLANKDFDGAAKLATKDSKTTLDMMKKAVEAGEKMGAEAKDEKDPTEEFKKVEFGETMIDGETATVMVTNTEKKEDQQIQLKKEDGAWKVDFSMSALQKMGNSGDNTGMDAMNEEGETVTQEDLEKSM